MPYIIQQRRDTAERWASANPILLEGEVGYVTDNPNQYKIGDGVTAWNDLPYRGYTGTISQETGTDENAVMSQKATTEKFNAIESQVTNIADDEDLEFVATSADTSVLKLADRTYDEASFSGKGYKILRKNIQKVTVAKFDLTITSGCTTSGDVTVTIDSTPTTISVTTDSSTPESVAELIASSISGSTVSGAVVSFTSQPTVDFSSTGIEGSVSDVSYTENRNVLTQDMINESNTVYEIRYDFDLNGEEITIPEGCTLYFNSGSLNNGIINLNYNEIINFKGKDINIYNIINNNIEYNTYISYNDYPAFPKIKGDFNITCYNNSSTVKNITINAYDINDSVIDSISIKAIEGGYNQNISLSNNENIVRYAIITTDYIKISFNDIINYNGIKVFDTFEDFNNSTNVFTNDIVYVKGYYKKFDDGDAFWAIEPISKKYSLFNIINVVASETKSTTRFIGVTSVILNNGLRAVLLNKDKKINVLKLGVKNTGEETSDVLQSIIDNCTHGDELYFPGGRYFFNKQLTFKKHIILTGDIKIGVAGSAISAAEAPYWHNDYNNPIITISDNGNSYTIFRFNAIDKNNITFIDGGSNDISITVNNIIFTCNSFDFEGTYGGEVLAPPENPLHEIINYENISCINKVGRIINCAFVGFSGKAIILAKYAFVQDVSFSKCNICIESSSDTNINNIRASSCVTIIITKSLNQIANVRGDSIKGYVFICQNAGSIFRNIEIDYCLKSCFYLESNCESIDIDANCVRTQVNSWNNNVDEGGSVNLDECFIYTPYKVLGLKLNIHLIDAHATDFGSSDEYDNHIMYPCILGCDNTILNLNANIDYGGNLNNQSTNNVSVNRLIQIGSNANISGRIINNQHFYIFENYSTANTKYIDNFVYADTSSERPVNAQVGFQYFDTTLNKPIWWTSSEWVDANGVVVDDNYPILTKGTTEQRPTLTSSDDGFEYYDSTLKKKILWNGTEWVNLDGTALV